MDDLSAPACPVLVANDLHGVREGENIGCVCARAFQYVCVCACAYVYVHVLGM